MYYLVGRASTGTRKRVYRIIDTEDFVCTYFSEAELVEMILMHGVVIENMFVHGYKLHSRHMPLDKIGLVSLDSRRHESKTKTVYCVIGLVVDEFNNVIGRIASDYEGNVKCYKEGELNREAIINIPTNIQGNDLLVQYNFDLIVQVQNSHTNRLVTVLGKSVTWYGRVSTCHLRVEENKLNKGVSKEVRELIQHSITENIYDARVIDETNSKLEGVHCTYLPSKTKISQKRHVYTSTGDDEIERKPYNLAKNFDLDVTADRIYIRRDGKRTYLAPILSDIVHEYDRKLFFLAIEPTGRYSYKYTLLVHDFRKKEDSKVLFSTKKGIPVVKKDKVLKEDYIYLMGGYERYTYDKERYTEVHVVNLNTLEVENLGDFEGYIGAPINGEVKVSYTYRGGSETKKLERSI